MSPVQNAFYVGVTAFNIMCMIVSLVSWSNARYLERKAARHRDMIFEAMMSGQYGRMKWETTSAEKPDA